MTAPHPMDVLFDAAADGDSVQIPLGWGQGRATFGGLLAGLLQARALGAWGLDPATLRSCTTSFVAPAAPGPARLEAILLRQGTSATQTEVRLWQQDERTGAETVRTVQLSSYGTARESTIEVTAPTVRDLPAVKNLVPVRYVRGLTPEFLAQVELTPASGGLPFSGASEGNLTGFMRYRESPAAMSLPHFICLVDAWPPAVGAMLRAPAAMSTLTWTLELLGEPTGDPDQRWFYQVATDAAHEGYAHTHATISTAAGRPLAISRQTISVFG